jgi:BASS family bile acid:Na+ symporter
MANFFFSCLSIELSSVWNALKSQRRQIITFTIMKLAVLPIILFYVFDYFAPDYALSALLLTGVSTGVVAPFISNLVKGNSSLVLVVVVLTSALAPFTLPALIKIVAVSQVDISFFGMIRMLALVIFVPLLAVEALRRLTPGLIAPLMKRQFPVSLLLFAIINLGVFYRYAPFFKKEPLIIVMATIAAIVLSAIYYVTGIFFFRKSSVENQLAGTIMLGNMNYVLVIVFSSQFFGPVEPLVAAMYVIPFFGLVIPLRYHYNSKTKNGAI